MTVEQMIKDGISDDIEVQEVTVVKNNGLQLNGVTIKKIDVQIAPTIYRKDDESDEDFAERCIGMWNDGSLKSDITDLDVNNTIMNIDYVYDHVMPALINRNKNKDRIKDLFHTPFLDMEIIYKIVVSNNSFGRGAVVIKNELLDKLKSLGLDIHYLETCAMSNLVQKVQVESMFNVLKAMMPNSEDLVDDTVDMLVATTVDKIDGASCIINNDAMKLIHEKLNARSVYIIPSSVHEVIAVPMVEDSDPSYIVNMIRDVNATQIAPDEILSDNLYISTFVGGNFEWSIYNE